MTAVATKIPRDVNPPPGTALDRKQPVPESPAIRFDALLATALAEWPEALALPVHPANGSIIVEGLIDLERAISGPWIRHPREVLLSNLHWAICTVVHARFKQSPQVALRTLNPADIRRKFESDLRSIQKQPANWRPQDLALIERYFAESRNPD
jgi:hypothetical protein